MATMARNGNITFDTKIPIKSSFVLNGTSGVGKTYLCLEMIRHRKTAFTEPIQNAIFIFQTFQPEFLEFKDDSKVTFTDKLEDIDDIIAKNPHENYLVIIDDQLLKLELNAQTANFVAQFFIYRCSHNNSVPVLNIHNFFSKSVRLITLNSKYLFLFKVTRDFTQISVLGNQLGCGGDFLKWCLSIACERKGGYLVIDLHANTPDQFRFRNFLWPTNNMIVFMSPQCASVLSRKI